MGIVRCAPVPSGTSASTPPPRSWRCWRLACLAVAFAIVTVVARHRRLPLAALAAVAAFQALRVPVGRAASWMLDR